MPDSDTGRPWSRWHSAHQVMDNPSNAPVGEHANACKLCGETRTFSRTYTVVEGPTFTLRYFTCKHPLADVTKAQPSSTVHPTQ
jgi:hypothetical protein